MARRDEPEQPLAPDEMSTAEIVRETFYSLKQLAEEQVRLFRLEVKIQVRQEAIAFRKLKASGRRTGAGWIEGERLLQTVEPDKWSGLLKQDENADRREFLRAIDAVKKRTQRGRRHAGIPADDVVADRRAIHEGQVQNERQAVYEVAADVLTPRQQRILHLSADGWSVQEIGKDLHISADRVSDEKYKAIRKLRTFFKSEETAA